MKIIEYGYTDKNGFRYDNLKVIKYDSLKNLKKEAMKYTNGTQQNDNNRNLIKEMGINIYQLDNNPNVAYRLYRDMNYFQSISHEEDCKLISLLTKKQESVTLTDFPTAVIAVQNPNNYEMYHVVGTEIPYYEDYQELNVVYNNIEKYTWHDLKYIYQQILAILKELNDVNIIYDDIHMGNILIRLSDLNIKLIDFESSRINTIGFNYNMIGNLKGLIYELNSKFGICYDNLQKAKSLDQIEKIINKKRIMIRK